jgi:hypothetical protein
MIHGKEMRSLYKNSTSELLYTPRKPTHNVFFALTDHSLPSSPSNLLPHGIKARYSTLPPFPFPIIFMFISSLLPLYHIYPFLFPQTILFSQSSLLKTTLLVFRYFGTVVPRVVGLMQRVWNSWSYK